MKTETKLTAKAVQALVTHCLFKEGESTENAVKAQGAVMSLGFHPERLEASREAIKELLEQLPEQFHQATGGGWSFLNACMTKENDQWGEHRDIDNLLCLAFATKQARFCFEDRKMWSILPGNMPYFVVLS